MMLYPGLIHGNLTSNTDMMISVCFSEYTHNIARATILFYSSIIAMKQYGRV